MGKLNSVWTLVTVGASTISKVTGVKGREGDFLELRDGSIFEVKGLVHPPRRFVAYPRYVLDDAGDRRRGFRRYRKVYPLKERYDILRLRYPSLLVYDSVFNMEVSEVPWTKVALHYRPDEALTKLSAEKSRGEAEARAVEFSQTLQDCSDVYLANFGLSGSIMIGLHTPSSDIDIMVYGRAASLRVKEALKNLLNEGRGGVRRYNADDLLKLYKFRVGDTVMPFEDFAKHEKRKTFQGVFQDREFFIRYLPSWEEIGEVYGDIRYYPEGYVKVKATVKDASESIYTPCRYILDHVEDMDGSRVQGIVEAVSFRGRFCEQAEAGEQVVLQGKVERVVFSDGEHRRVLLGGDPSDYMISLSLNPDRLTVG